MLRCGAPSLNPIMDVFRDIQDVIWDMLASRLWDDDRWFIVLTMMVVLCRVVNKAWSRAWVWTVPDRIGIGVIVLMSVLFSPWLWFHVDNVIGDVEYYFGDGHRIAVPQECIPDPVFDYAKGEAAERVRCSKIFVRCWHRDCDDDHMYAWYDVKPPWVPLWVMRHTLLRFVVPDYSGRCPSN